jgi:hypothetical protein
MPDSTPEENKTKRPWASFVAGIFFFAMFPSFPILLDLFLEERINLATLMVTGAILPVTIAVSSHSSFTFPFGIAVTVLMSVGYGAVADAGLTNLKLEQVLGIEVYGPAKVMHLAIWALIALAVTLFWAVWEQFDLRVNRRQKVSPLLTL